MQNIFTAIQSYEETFIINEPAYIYTLDKKQSTMESFNKNNNRLSVIIHIIENKYSIFCFVENMLKFECDIEWLIHVHNQLDLGAQFTIIFMRHS